MNKGKIMNEELKKVMELSERVRNRIIEECRISRVTFWNWQNGKTPIPFLAKEKIDEIMLQEVGKTIFAEQCDKSLITS